MFKLYTTALVLIRRISERTQSATISIGERTTENLSVN